MEGVEAGGGPVDGRHHGRGAELERQGAGAGGVGLEGGGVLLGRGPSVVEAVEAAGGRDVGEELLDLDDVDLNLLAGRDQVQGGG
ncbi:hypothetical protein [Phenylobacterium sp.]|uniref:hypothetical protein n=1 Tax=Phenylobacterium sp. TaxID=1871053 RepID=UPI003BA970C9